MIIYGMERAAKNEWWDLFCSRNCVEAVYGDFASDVEYFQNAESFQEQTGVWLDTFTCFNCRKEPKADKEEK